MKFKMLTVQVLPNKNILKNHFLMLKKTTILQYDWIENGE